MILNNYTQTRANKLARLSVPRINEPFEVRTLWLRALSFENSAGNITKNKHKHSYFEVHFMFSGTMRYDVDGEGGYELRAGNGLLISPQVNHTVRDFDHDLVKLSIAFSPDPESETFKKLASRGSRAFDIDREMLCAFEKIFEEVDGKGVLSAYIIREKVFSVLCALIRLGDAESDADYLLPQPEPDVRVASAIRYIEDNKNSFLSCEDVAEYCHFNVKYLNRIFKRYTSLTLLAYIHDVKIKEAERLLSQSDLSLADIAMTLGFANVYYFSSFFKRYSAISPGAYRRLIKSDPDK